MIPKLLIYFAVGQGVLLVVTVIALFATHWAFVGRDYSRAVELERARSIVRQYLARRMLAVEAQAELNVFGSHTLAAILHEFTANQSGDEREAIYQLLQGTRWYRKLPDIARSRFWWRRLRASRAISTLAAPEHLLLMHALLDDRSPAVRLSAATALERLPSPGLAAALLERAVASHGAERNHLVEILVQSETLVAPVITARLSQTADNETLRVLLRLASRVGDPALLTYVVPHASSESLEVRIAAATALRSFPHPQTSNTLRRLLTDRAWEVRARAAASLGIIGAVEAIGDLEMALCDPNWWVRLRSAIALRLVGPMGVEALRAVQAEIDRYAFDMAQYVLCLDEGVMAEYMGGATLDGSSPSMTAPASAMAS